MKNDIPLWKRLSYILSTLFVFLFIGYLLFTWGNML